MFLRNRLWFLCPIECATMLLCSVACGLEFLNCCLVVPAESQWLGCERPKSDAGHELPSGPGFPDCTALAPHVHIWHSDWFGDLKRLKKGLGPALYCGPALVGQEVKSSPYPQVDKPILLGAKTLKANQPWELFPWVALGFAKPVLLFLCTVTHPHISSALSPNQKVTQTLISKIQICYYCTQNVKAMDMTQ